MKKIDNDIWDDIFREDKSVMISDGGDFLHGQLITYLGNKRNLSQLLRDGILFVQNKLSKNKLNIFDGFSGSGAASRKLKAYAKSLHVNDMELYAKIISECYLSNKSQVDYESVEDAVKYLNEKKLSKEFERSFIEELYAPKDDENIQVGERVFYTNKNAKIIDNIRRMISDLDKDIQHLLIAPLLYEASVHTNTSGVFKGFYRNSFTKIGQFGGDAKNCTKRIKKEIELSVPVFSMYECDIKVYQEDTNEVIKSLPEMDLVYYDPPYNQHPYSSNYFMLNLISSYQRPNDISNVSGIPKDWNRSAYNTSKAESFLENLIANTRSKFILLSYNNEGIVSCDKIEEMMNRYGKCKFLEESYPTFRASRNLKERSKKVREFLFILEKV